MAEAPPEYVKYLKKMNGLCLTLAILAISWAVLPGCRPLTTDLSNRQLPGMEETYNPGSKLGASAKSLVSSRNFKRVVVEIVAVAGRLPTTDATNHLRAFLEKTLAKPRGVEIREREIPSPGLATYSQLDIEQLELRHRQHRTKLDQIAVFVLILDGKSANSAGALQDFGRSYRNTSTVIFEDTIRHVAESNQVNPWVLEATVLEHEFGHVLGLVHVNSPGGENHCPNPACLMYKTAFSPAILPLLKSDTVPEFDAACRQELKTLAQD